jgi:tetratricopeptide (TPR) repeat protein
MREPIRARRAAPPFLDLLSFAPLYLVTATLTLLTLLVLGACAPGADDTADDTADAAPPAEAAPAGGDVIGEVSFSTTCDPELQEDFDEAIATLHSFEYDEARGQFASIAERDPECAIAHWGVAMTWFHPLWAPPTPAELEAGQAAIEQAASVASETEDGDTSERERQYIDALAAFYRDADSLPHSERSQRWEAAMAEVRESNPDDVEATIFYGLSRLANLDMTDKTYAVQKETGAMLEPLFAEMPNHPGLAHYIIHSYDFPPLAAQAEQAAHRYLDIATSMPHALHMSGHIFTQLGMWEDSIEANSRSAQAARERAAKSAGMGGQAQMNEMHALDYQLYAHLQRGEVDEAREIVEHVEAQEGLNWQHGIVAFNAGAVPVRWAMERKAWEEAADLPPLTGAEAAAAAYTQGAVALRHWARAVGAARSGDPEQAEADLAKLTGIAETMKASDDVWARNTGEVLRQQAEAWLAFARGEQDRALELLRSAAALEDRTDKSGLSPGRVLPAHEQLGDLLMELDRPDEALAEYEESLKHAPLRLNSHLGAARAAVDAGKPEIARAHYQHLRDLVVEGSPAPARQEAVDFLSGTA